MMKSARILFCVILCSTGSFGQLEFIQRFIETTGANITRVRTPEERDSRWNDFAVLDFIGLVEQFDGYTAEEYDLETSDGYLLKLHRISGSPFSPKTPGKPPVFIGHGLFVSSDIHVVYGPQQALTFMLADAGYDVWIGNFRGNSYSRRHVKYSTSGNSFDYWNFSMDELGLIDLPLFIDTILEKTNQRKLTYIGYSMGSTLSYILLSGKPEYNDKMTLVLNVAPVALFSRPLSQILQFFTVIAPPIKSFAVAHRMYWLFPQSKFFNILGKDICSTKQGVGVCEGILKLVASIDRVNATVLPTLFAHIPSGTSLNTMDHYYQMIATGKFRHYDFGMITNKAKYNSIAPPEYDLSKITSPQAIFYAESDIYASFRDTQILKSKLPNVVAFVRAPSNFNHLDFILHPDARDTVYKRLLEVMAQYS